MSILLTGASGFVGAYMQRLLPACVPLNDVENQIDLRDAAAVARAVARVQPDAVIHLGGQSFVPASFKEPRETYEINFIGTFNLLAALQSCGFGGTLLFVGSGDGYGRVAEASLPITEGQPLRPRSPYGVSKVAAEALCFQWSQGAGPSSEGGPFRIVMTRSFNHIGPGQSERFVVSDFAKQVMEIKLARREAVLSVGDIDVTRDFTDVRDATAAYALLLDHGRNGEVYNVCSNAEHSIRSILQRLLDLAEVSARIEVDPSRVRAGEQRRLLGSHEKLCRDTGWMPRISLDESLRDILRDWEERLS